MSSLQDIAENLAANEKRLLNLEVEGEAIVYDRPLGSSDPWRRSPIESRVHWWVNGKIGSKARVDRYKVLRWDDGAAPFGYGRESVGFDGTYGISLEHEFGTSEKEMHRVRGGQITAIRPGGLSDWCAGGMQFSIFYRYAEIGETLSDALFKELNSNIQPVISYEEYLGAQAIKIEWVVPSGSSKAFIRDRLDPKRGYAFLGHESVVINGDGRTTYHQTLEVTELVEAVPGVWYPTKATLTAPDLERGVEERYTYTASRVIANNPDFDESIYRVEIPDGYTIVDKVMGIRYRTGTPPAGLEPYLRESGVNAYGETVRVLAASPIDLVSDDAPDAFAAQRRRPLLWAAGILTIIAAAVAWRYHSKGASA